MQKELYDSLILFGALNHYNNVISSTTFEIAVKKHNELVSHCENAYKSLAKLHHPDHGGDAEEMKRINASMDQIKKLKPTRPIPVFQMQTSTIIIPRVGDLWAAINGSPFINI